MSTKLLISFLMVMHSTFVLCYTSGDQALASIKRLEKLHKAIEEETKILKIRAYSVFGESKGKCKFMFVIILCMCMYSYSYSCDKNACINHITKITQFS
jgi:hypothetical protein